MIGSWTPEDTLAAADRVKALSHREMVANSYRQTIRGTEQLDAGLAELRHELDALNAAVDARAARPLKPTGRKRTRTRST